MIVFEGDYVLYESLRSVYDFASKILIAEGPVSYWQKQGRTTSTDNTNEILDTFPDPQNKIKIIHGQYQEKDDQCNAYMKYLPRDTDYLWNLDSDEVYRQQDIENFIKILEIDKYTSFGVRSKTFYGGFDRYITGFEQAQDNFLRIFRVCPDCTWKTHRPPTIQYPENTTFQPLHMNSDTLYEMIGFEMYHYSYVFPKQVYNKLKYYMDIGGMGNRIQNYFWNVYWPWITGNASKQAEIEKKYLGVHEYLPAFRGVSFTAPFTGIHPTSINTNKAILQERIKQEIEYIQTKLKVANIKHSERYAKGEAQPPAKNL